MNLLFSIDRKNIFLLISCLRSIVQNGGEDSYCVYVLHTDISQEEQEKIKNMFCAHMLINFLYVDETLFLGYPVSKRYPQQIYYRLLAPVILPDTVDRILYLDVDTVVINPLKKLYNTLFDGAFYIACTHTGKLLTRINQLRLKTKKSVPYVNTGVLLIDIQNL